MKHFEIVRVAQKLRLVSEEGKLRLSRGRARDVMSKQQSRLKVELARAIDLKWTHCANKSSQKVVPDI